jgi:hypothetical protein
MHAYKCLLTLLLCAAPSPARADETPIVFARSGQKTTLPVRGDDGKAGGTVILSAFGKQWGEPATVAGNAAEFVAPAVRAPTVFRAVRAGDDNSVLGEVVVYPDKWLPWETDKQLAEYRKTQFVAAGVPDWLNAWFGAVGFPIEKLSGPEALEKGNWRMLEKPALLILGRKTAGRGPAEVGRQAIDHRANVLVIEADWLDKSTTPVANIVLAPKRARDVLADLQAQEWPSPPTFRRQTVPWPVLWNRLTWIDGTEYPLVEEVYSRQKGAESLRIVFNYLPWQEQLGRCEMADELLLRILAETAKGAEDRPPLQGRWCLLYPAIEKLKTEERPVLFAARRSAATKVGSEGAIVAATESPDIGGYVLDLRSGSRLPDELFADTGILKQIEPRINKHTSLLILGDNRQLDSWEWLALDREHQKSPRPGVCWLPDSALPPNLESQLRVMEVFTQWNVFLGDTSREKSYEDRENEL